MTKFRMLATATAAVVTASFSMTLAVAQLAPSHQAAHALYDVLSASPQPRDRALAAWMIVPKTDDERSMRRVAFAFAAAAAPKDVLVQWLAANAIGGCPKAPEDTATLRLFRQLEPDNAAGNLLQLNHTAACGDNVRIGATLGEMAHAKRFDSHFGLTVQAWLDVLSTKPSAKALLQADAVTGKQLDPLSLALNYATVAAEPDFTPLLDACPKGSLTNASVCAKIGHILAYTSKTALDRAIGFNLIERSDAMTASDKVALRELHWLMSPPSGKQLPAEMGRIIAIGWSHSDDEIQILRQAFGAGDLPLTPPANWVDPVGKQPAHAGEPPATKLPHWSAPTGSQQPPPANKLSH
ncbi:MAG: hypothetical protein ABI365_05295 [Lysobacteraceae bacterium]